FHPHLSFPPLPPPPPPPSFPTRRSSDLPAHPISPSVATTSGRARGAPHRSADRPHTRRRASWIRPTLRARHGTTRGCVRDRSDRSEEHTSELQSLTNLVCRLLLEKKKTP